MATRTIDVTRGPYDPGGQPELETENDLLLGIFAWNISGGTAPTKAVLLDPDRRHGYWRWPQASRLIQEAERIGCEFNVPFGRWLGQDGATRYNEDVLDFLAVAAGNAAITERIMLPSTAHAGFGFHPVHFAKWGASIDQMSRGRWALNVVAGWIRDEAGLLGGVFHDHDRRYEICDEFVTLMKLCWTEEEPFDFEGEFFQARDVDVRPKPFRDPRPVLVNAGSSPAGTDFAARHCDWLFLANPSQQLDKLKAGAERGVTAAEKYDRRLRILSFTYCIWAETDAEAEREYQQQKDMLDEAAVNWHLFRGLDQPGAKSGVSFAPAAEGESGQTLREFIGEEAFVHYGLGIAGHHIIGGYDTVAETIRHLYEECGQEGILFSWIDPLKGLHQLEDEIMPRLRRMGLRK